MNVFSEKLRKTLIDASAKVYDMLEVFDEEPIKIRQVHEDGISSILLKQLARLRSEDIYVKIKSLDVDEAKTGVDFNLWIGENDKSYIRLVVQAKSLLNECSTESSYKIDIEQCEKIISHSGEKPQAFPMYFLYQHIKHPELKEKHFSFLEDFLHEHSGITVTSAFNILKLSKAKKMKELPKKKSVKFSEIHNNQLKHKWKNDIYGLFEKNDEKVGLPLYCLYDISPSKVEQFNRLISDRLNSARYFYFFPHFFMGENFPLRPHKITAEEIVKRYGQNDPKSEVQFKNLIIINDKFKTQRDRVRKIEEALKE